MREQEFKGWLRDGGARLAAGRTRAYAVRTIEKNLANLGSPHADLEEAWKADGFEQLRRRLTELREDFDAGGTDYRILLPQSEKPRNRLSSWRSWLGQYGQFLRGEPRGDRDADRIRQYVLESYIEPAREAEADTVDVLVRDVNKALGLNQAWPNICQALTRPKFMEMADVGPAQRIGADQSSATVFRFRLDGTGSRDMKSSTKRNFVLFDAAGSAFKPVLNYHRGTGRSSYRIRPLGASNRADEAIEVDTIAEVARAMLVDGLPARVQSLAGGPVNYVGYGKQKLVRYELDPTIAAQIGVPPRGEVARTSAIGVEILSRLRAVFLERFEDFISFEQPGGYATEEDIYKRTIIGRAQDLIKEHSDDDDAVLGEALLDLAAAKDHNLLGYYKTYQDLEMRRSANPGVLEQAAGQLVRGTGDPGDLIDPFVETIWPLFADPKNNPYGDSRIIASLLLALVRPTEAVFVRTEPFNNAGLMLTGQKLFGWNPLTGAEYRAALALSEAIFVAMRDEWGWRPRDLWDVQDFIWVTCQQRLGLTAGNFEEDHAALMADIDSEERALQDGPYWFVGASYGRRDDQVERFLAEGIWDIDSPSDRDREKVMRMQRGERIAIKATYVRKNGLPFDNLGRSVSVMAIKAIGTITDNPGDGERLSVAWEPVQATREWYHYTYQPTIWEVYPTNEMAQRLIRFAFHGEAQDYGWFLQNLPHWGGLPAERAPPPDPVKRSPLNLILYGPPGTGKTYRTMAVAVGLCRGLADDNPLLIEAGRRQELRQAYEELKGQGQIGFVTFHQNYAYEDFVEGLRPQPLVDGVGFTLTARSGVLRQMAEAAEASAEEHVLIIDEINRANISKVFGELITLIEPDKRLGMEEGMRLTLPYSGARFGFPANLHIVGTMNTADRSIALLDTALRRRFEFRELMPDPSLLEPIDGIDLASLLSTINERIEYLFDREHQIGHAYFLGCRNRADVDEVMRRKIIPLLAEYFYEDWVKVGAVLGDASDAEGDHEGRFLDRRRLKAPSGLGDDQDTALRYRWSVREAFSYDGFAGG